MWRCQWSTRFCRNTLRWLWLLNRRTRTLESLLSSTSTFKNLVSKKTLEKKEISHHLCTHQLRRTNDKCLNHLLNLKVTTVYFFLFRVQIKQTGIWSLHFRHRFGQFLKKTPLRHRVFRFKTKQTRVHFLYFRRNQGSIIIKVTNSLRHSFSRIQTKCNHLKNFKVFRLRHRVFRLKNKQTQFHILKVRQRRFRGWIILKVNNPLRHSFSRIQTKCTNLKNLKVFPLHQSIRRIQFKGQLSIPAR